MWTMFKKTRRRPNAYCAPSSRLRIFAPASPNGSLDNSLDDGAAEGYDRILQVLSELPYDRWREYDPEDTMRYYALRLHEVGLIKSTPQKIIADGTDWRFLDELKRELKA